MEYANSGNQADGLGSGLTTGSATGAILGYNGVYSKLQYESSVPVHLQANSTLGDRGALAAPRL